MKVFRHHVYEYKKGLRNLILHTADARYRKEMIEKLSQNKIAYLIQDVTDKKINVIFGDPVCIKVLESFGEKPLRDFSDEEDFILGIMLGYCRRIQCERYLKRIKTRVNLNKKIFEEVSLCTN